MTVWWICLFGVFVNRFPLDLLNLEPQIGLGAMRTQLISTALAVVFWMPTGDWPKYLWGHGDFEWWKKTKSYWLLATYHMVYWYTRNDHSIVKGEFPHCRKYTATLEWPMHMWLWQDGTKAMASKAEISCTLDFFGCFQLPRIWHVFFNTRWLLKPKFHAKKNLDVFFWGFSVPKNWQHEMAFKA